VTAKVDPHRTGDPAIDGFLPPPGTFADSVYRVAMGTSTDEMDMAWMAAVANDIMTMPEMQAIREVLRRIAVRAAADADARWGLLWNELPPNVKRWATSPALAEWVRSDP
jgi:hypothetical protein